jgi:hypothetical protein
MPESVPETVDRGKEKRMSWPLSRMFKWTWTWLRGNGGLTGLESEELSRGLDWVRVKVERSHGSGSEAKSRDAKAFSGSQKRA